MYAVSQKTHGRSKTSEFVSCTHNAQAPPPSLPTAKTSIHSIRARTPLICSEELMLRPGQRPCRPESPSMKPPDRPQCCFKHTVELYLGNPLRCLRRRIALEYRHKTRFIQILSPRFFPRVLLCSRQYTFSHLVYTIDARGFTTTSSIA